MPIARVQLPDGRIGRFEVPEGTTPEQVQAFAEAQFKAPEPKKPEGPGMAESAIQGGAQGASLGFGDEIMGGLAGAGRYGISRVINAPGSSEKDFSQIYREERDKIRRDNKQASEANPMSYGAGYFAGAVASPAKFGGNIAAQGAKYGAAFGVGESEADSAAGVAGDAAKGATIGYAGGKVLQGAGRALKGFGPVKGEAGRLAEVAAKEGIELTPAQATGSRVLRGLETGFAELPLTSGKQGQIAEKQLKQFTKAAMRKAGIEADTATPEVMAAAKQKFNTQFEAISKRNVVKVDDELLNALGGIEQEAGRRLGPDMAKGVQSFIDDVLSSGSKIDGVTYQNTRSRLGAMANGTNDGFVRGLLKDMQTALDDAANRSISKKDAAGWADLRKKYGAFKTIEKAMGSTSKAAVEGAISPGALATAAKTTNRNFASGAGELNDISRVGAAFLRDPVGNSGTAQRQLWQNVLSGGIGASGYALGGLPGAVGSMLAPRAAQAVYNTGPVQRALVNGIGASIPAGAGRIPGMLGGAAATTAPQPEAPPAPPPATPQQQAPMPQPEANAQGDYFAKLAQAESGNNPAAKNPNSSAFGKYQFTYGTWKDMVGKYGQDTGIKMTDWGNPQAQDVMANLLTRENAAALSGELGRAPTHGELYAAHFLGARGAKKLLSAMGTGQPAAKLFPEAAKANKPIFYDRGRARTVEEVYQLLEDKVA